MAKEKSHHVSTNLYTSSDGETYSVTVYVKEEAYWVVSFNADFGERPYTYHRKGEMVGFYFDPHTKTTVTMGDRRDGVEHEVPTTYFSEAKKNVTVKFYTTTKRFDSQAKAR